MPRVNDQGYVEIIKDNALRSGRYNSKSIVRNWWLVKYMNTCGILRLNNIYFPKKWIGKRVRLKIEEIKD